MKVVCFINKYEYSGAPLSLYDSCRALINDGYEVYIIGPRRGKLTLEFEKLGCNIIEEKLIDSLPINFKFKFLKIIYMPLRIIINIILQIIFIWHFLRLDPKFILLNSFTTRFAVFASFLFPVKVIWHIHEDFKTKEHFSKAFKYLVYHCSSLILTNSEQSINNWITWNDRKKYRSIFNTVGEIPSKEILNTETQYDIVFAGRITQDKGFWNLLKALEILKEQKVKKINILVVGVFMDFVFQQKVENFIYKNLKEFEFEFVNYVENIFEAIAKAKFMVMPSHDETFCRVVGESLACGRPVIATKVGGIPEYIVDGHNGFLINIKDELKLAEKIKLFLDDPCLTKKMGLNGYETARKRLSFEVYQRDFINAVNEITVKGEYERVAFGKRVVCFVHEYKMTGAPLCLLETCKVLIKNKYDVYLIGPKKELLFNEFDKLNIKVFEVESLNRLYNYTENIFLRILFLPVRISINIFIQILFLSYFARIKPDIILLNSFASRFAAVSSFLYPAKVIWHILEDYSTKRFYSKIFRYFVWICSNKVITISDNSTKLWKVGKSKKYVKILNPVNPSKELFNKNYEKIFDLVFVGRITQQKGINVLLDSLKLYQSRYNEGLSCVIVGNFVTEEYKKEIEDLIAKNFSKLKIEFKINHPDPLEVMLQSRFFVLPTLDDNVPRVLAEAMYCKIPIIATRIGGIPEVVKDGVNGFLIEPGDVEILCEKIHYCKNNPQKTEEMGLKGFETGEKMFSFKLYEQKIINSFSEIVK